ncbi:hypothetical protein ACTFIW_010083 [Dictyostelium discoideum]
MSESNLISDWLNTTLKNIKPKEKDFTIYIKSNFEKIKSLYKSSSTVVVSCKSGWTAVHTDNIQVLRDASNSFKQTKIKNSTIISITSKFPVDHKEYLTTMSSDLKNKFIKCDPGNNHSTFTFIGVNTEWEPEPTIKALNDFTVINITKWKILKYKESGAKEENKTNQQTTKPKQSTQPTQPSQPSQSTQQTPKTLSTENNINNLNEQELAELIFNNTQEAEQEKGITKEIQLQKIQSQNKQNPIQPLQDITQQTIKCQGLLQSVDNKPIILSQESNKKEDNQEPNTNNNKALTPPPKDKDEPSFNLSSQFDVSISTQEINNMLNTDFIFDNSSPIPDKLLEPITPEPIVFSIRELDSPTKDIILNELLYQPDQSIYNKTIEESIEDHLKVTLNDSSETSSTKRKYQEESNPENDLEQISTIMNNNLQKIDKNLSISLTK